jgi:hypothetical protein
MSFCVVPRNAVVSTPCSVALVDRHRRVHLAGRDPVEQLAHVTEVHDGHAHLADLAPGEQVVGVVAGLGGEVEGDREPRLALRQVGAVQLV